jgi:hypothetical protein
MRRNDWLRFMGVNSVTFCWQMQRIEETLEQESVTIYDTESTLTRGHADKIKLWGCSEGSLAPCRFASAVSLNFYILNFSTSLPPFLPFHALSLGPTHCM